MKEQIFAWIVTALAWLLGIPVTITGDKGGDPENVDRVEK